MKAKPLLEDKLVTWKRAYDYVLEELLHGGTVFPPAQYAELRAAAARTAAVLIQGVEHGND